MVPQMVSVEIAVKDFMALYPSDEVMKRTRGLKTSFSRHERKIAEFLPCVNVRASNRFPEGGTGDRVAKC